MPFGAGAVAAGDPNAIPVDPRPFAVGSIAETLARFPHIETVVPAMGYSDAQLRDLQATINAVDCDAVIAGTPIDLGRLVDSRHPIREVTRALEELGSPRGQQPDSAHSTIAMCARGDGPSGQYLSSRSWTPPHSGGDGLRLSQRYCRPGLSSD